MKIRLAALMAVVALFGYAWAQKAPADPVLGSLEALGEALFFDVDLSANRSQSCATCHDPGAGFVDLRENATGRAVSLGDDGVSLGDRNTPTLSYAAFSPVFHRNEDGEWIGGQFMDGREADLEGQAGAPPLNPIEMGMPDKRSVVARLMEKPEYVASMTALFAPDIFDDPERAYAAMTQAIAAFERTDFFAPFDSKYDRFLRGEYQLTHEEELGRFLFFSQALTNCSLCHQLSGDPRDPRETFTNYEYHNIGVPANPKVRLLNGLGADFVDLGLYANPAVDDPRQQGKFKVPTLRNVAITGPYMRNGVFKDLRTVMMFYNRFNSRDAAFQINPETGKTWLPPETSHSLAVRELTHGPVQSDARIDALVAFMRILTDARYEHLLEE